MRSRSHSLLCTLLVLAAVAYPDSASGCSCAHAPLPCAAVPGSVIFVGTVQNKSDTPQRIDSLGPPTYTFELSVIEPFAGVSSPKVTVHTATDGAACGFPFKIGESYVVHASETSGGRYLVSGCSRTRRLADAKDDLILLRQAAKGQRSSRVFGQVVRRALQVNGRLADSDAVGPEIGIPVIARKGDFSVETATDGDGRFVFEGLAPGRYEIEPRWPRGLKSMVPVGSVSVGPCGAGDINFWAIADAPLGGTVRGPDGAPVGKFVAVTAIKADQSDRRAAHAAERSAFAFTDDRGQYAFDGLPAGRYLIGINVVTPPMPSSPYPPTYHPSGSDPTHAVPLEVIDGQQRRIDLRLPARLPTRRVTGVVVDEHDVPVIGASVTLTDLEFPHALSMIRATSDIVGGFEVEAFEGREYLLQVLGFTPKRSGEIRLTRGASSSGLRVVLR